MTDCSKCKYSYENNCDVTRVTKGCYECENFDENTLNCRCLNIPEYEDCPYFVEYEEEDDV